MRKRVEEEPANDRWLLSEWMGFEPKFAVLEKLRDFKQRMKNITARTLAHSKN